MGIRDEQYFADRPVILNGHNNLLEIKEHMYILDEVKKLTVVIREVCEKLGVRPILYERLKEQAGK